MRKKIMMVAVLSMVLLAGCKKEPIEQEGGISLGVNLEQVGGPDSKIYLLGNDIPKFFETGETVNVNGKSCTITKNNQSGKYFVNNVVEQADGIYYAFYPTSMLVLPVGVDNPGRSDVYSAGTDDAITCTVKFPRVQHYMVRDGKQKLDLPVGAIINGSGNVFNFYNLASLVEVKYTPTSNVKITSIEVTALGTDLWGNATATINTNSSRMVIDDYDGDHNRVILDIPNGNLTAGTQYTYYIMVPPFETATTQFSVKLRFDDGHSSFTKTKQSVSLDRNVIVSLVCNDTPQEDTELSGYYSVRSDLKVVFSKGNLQHRGVPSNVGTGTWFFADNQYDYYGVNNSNSWTSPTESERISNTVDLFSLSISHEYHYGAQGQDGLAIQSYGVRAPESQNEYAYYGDSRFVDWGDLVINGNSANTWFTLTQSEWNYLLNTRPNAHALHANVVITGVSNHPGSTTNNTVNRVYGYIFFPDDFNNPEDIPEGIDLSNGLNEITAAEFRRLESVGAVFMPAGGYRESRNDWVDYITSDNTHYYLGCYWTSTSDYPSAENNYIQYQANVNNYVRRISAPTGKWYIGQSVRLAKPAPGYTYAQAQTTSDLPTPPTGVTYRPGPSSSK